MWFFFGNTWTSNIILYRVPYLCRPIICIAVICIKQSNNIYTNIQFLFYCFNNVPITVNNILINTENGQAFLLVKLKSSLRKFYGRHYNLVNRYGKSVSQMTCRNHFPIISSFLFATISWLTVMEYKCHKWLVVTISRFSSHSCSPIRVQPRLLVGFVLLDPLFFV